MKSNVHVAAKQNVLSDITLKMSVAATVALATATPALAAPTTDAEFGEMFGSDYNATSKFNAGATKDTATSIFDVIKIVLVVIGLYFFAAGVMQLIKANKSNGQIPAGSAWTMIIGGGVLGVAPALYFALGGGLKDTLIATTATTE